MSSLTSDIKGIRIEQSSRVDDEPSKASQTQTNEAGVASTVNPAIAEFVVIGGILVVVITAVLVLCPK